MHKLSLSLKYLQYLVQAKTRYWIHSPFLFALIKEVFRDRRNFYAYVQINELRKDLLANNERIEVQDFGAGSAHFTSNQRKVRQIARHTAIRPKYGKLLFRLVNHFQPQKILEIGTGLGISTLYLASAAKHSKVISLEGSSSLAQIARQNFDQLKLGNIEVMEGAFDKTLSTALNNLGNLDFAFIDGDHTREGTLRNFETCLDYINERSILIFDDLYWSKEMEAAWREIIQNQKIRLSIDLFQIGILFFNEDIKQKQHLRLFF